MIALSKQSKALDADVLGTIVSRFNAYEEIVALSDISSAHHNIARRFVTSIRKGRPIPARSVYAFTRLETIEAPLVTVTVDETVEATMWALSRSVPVRLICDDRVVLRKKSVVNDAMVFAATNGNRELINICIEKGANNWDDAMSFAARNGHLEIVECLWWLPQRADTATS